MDILLQVQIFFAISFSCSGESYLVSSAGGINGTKAWPQVAQNFALSEDVEPQLVHFIIFLCQLILILYHLRGQKERVFSGFRESIFLGVFISQIFFVSARRITV